MLFNEVADITQRNSLKRLNVKMMLTGLDVYQDRWQIDWLNIYIPHDTKQVISEAFLPTSLLA